MLATRMYQQILSPKGDISEVEVVETKDGIKEVPCQERKLGKWEYVEIYKFLLGWIKLFTESFDLLCDDLFDTLPVLEIAKIRKTERAMFCAGYTPRGEPYSRIVVNSLYVNLPKHEMLAHLLHALVHCHFWVDAVENEKKNSTRHSKAFVQKMLQYGILVDSKGQHLEYCKVEYTQPKGKKGSWEISKLQGKNRFAELLKSHGIDCPEHEIIPAPPREAKKAKTNWKEKAMQLENKVAELESKSQQQVFDNNIDQDINQEVKEKILEMLNNAAEKTMRYTAVHERLWHYYQAGNSNVTVAQIKKAFADTLQMLEQEKIIEKTYSNTKNLLIKIIG